MIIDPPPAPEGGTNLRAADLKNRVLLLRPTGHDTVEGKDGKPWEFVECDVWVLDRAGIVEEGTGVRFSWWKAVAQLKGSIGQFVACKPVEQDDRSVELLPLSGDARQVAEKVAAEIGLRAVGGVPTPAGYDPGSEPF